MAIPKKQESTITEDMLKELQGELRDLDLNWADRLQKQIKDNKEVDKAVRRAISTNMIYNVFNKIIKNNKKILIVFTQAKKLRDLMQSEATEAIKSN